MKSICIVIGAVLILAGCSSTPSAPPVHPWNSGDVVTFKVRTNGLVVRRAIIIGMTQVDPGAYNGWSGELPGSAVDAENFRSCAQRVELITLC